jgi:mycofactocin precursor
MPNQPKTSPITSEKPAQEEPKILEEIVIEELSIDGICGVY